jgi:hypothetical protein
MLTKEEGGTVCGMPSNSTPLPPSGSPNRGMEDSIRDAVRDDAPVDFGRGVRRQDAVLESRI